MKRMMNNISERLCIKNQFKLGKSFRKVFAYIYIYIYMKKAMNNVHVVVPAKKKRLGKSSKVRV
jgi:hypothetical protein